MAVFNDRFLFIHIPKTAGSAVKFWLLDHLPGARGQRPDNPESSRDAGLPIGHIPLRHIVDPPAHWRETLGTVPRPVDSFQKIVAIVRNPYHQQVSQYRFWLQRGSAWLEVDVRTVDLRNPQLRAAMHPHDWWAVRAFAGWPGEGGQPQYDEQAGFRRWLQYPEFCDFHFWYQTHHAPGEKYERQFLMREAFDYYRYWLEVDGEIPDNVVILKMETLGVLWQREMEPFVPNPPPLPVVNSHSKGCPPLATFYTPEAAKLVEEKFPWTLDSLYYKGEW